MRHASSSPAVFVASLALAIGCALVMSPEADAAKKKQAKPKPPAVAAVSAECSNLYATANADWLRAHPPVGTFDDISALGELTERARAQQIALLEQAARAPDSASTRALGDLWASGMDEAAVDADGSKSIAPLLARIDAIRSRNEVPAALAALHQVGIPVAFDFAPDVDLDHLDNELGYFTPGGLGVADPAFYTRNDDSVRALQAAYFAYIKQVLALTGTPAKDLETQAQMVWTIETELARRSRALTTQPDPRSRFAKVTVKGLDKTYPNLRPEAFLAAQGVQASEVSIADPGYFKALDDLLKRAKPAMWQAYLRWRVGDAMAPYLSRTWRDAWFGFHGTLLATRDTPPARREQVLDAVNHALGPMLGRVYATAHLSATERNAATDVTTAVRDALAARVAASQWLGNDAKAEAARKLAALDIEIGAPAQDPDFTLPPLGRGSYGANMLIASTWRHREEMKRIGQPGARERWNALPQQPVISYDLAQNRLIVTAAVLQAPVFDATANAARRYGAFGALVGHELGHAVDDLGRNVSAERQLRDWWSRADRQAWSSRVNALAAQYSAQSWPGLADTRVDGARVAATAMADLDGLGVAEAAWRAHDAAPSVTAQREFFRAWAGVWAQRSGDGIAAERALTSPRAAGEQRSNLSAGNLDGFANAFSCKADAPMLRAVSPHVGVWD